MFPWWSSRILKTIFSFVNREPSILTALTGEIRLNTTFLEGRLGLIHKKPSYQPTGTLPSPRSASVWRLDNSSGSLWSTSRPTLCTRWSLMGNPAEPCWAVTRGRSWLGHRPLCSSTVSRTVLMPYLPKRSGRKQESVSLVTIKAGGIAAVIIQE